MRAVRIFIALSAAQFNSFASAQTFGGSPPWGLAKPAGIQVHYGARFEQPIGNGLTLRLTPQDDWENRLGCRMRSAWRMGAVAIARNLHRSRWFHWMGLLQAEGRTGAFGV